MHMDNFNFSFPINMIKKEQRIVSGIATADNVDKSNDVVEFLKENKCETLILNGDIIDGWALKRGGSWNESHMRCIRKFLKISKKNPSLLAISQIKLFFLFRILFTFLKKKSLYL